MYVPYINLRIMDISELKEHLKEIRSKRQWVTLDDLKWLSKTNVYAGQWIRLDYTRS